MEVGPLITRRVLSVGPHHSLRDVARMMRDNKVGAAAVRDDDGQLQYSGIITERDILRAVAEDADLAATRVSVYMTPAPVCASMSWDVAEAARTMRRGGFRHLIVLNDGLPVGMLSIRDLVEALLEMHEEHRISL